MAITRLPSKRKGAKVWRSGHQRKIRKKTLHARFFGGLLGLQIGNVFVALLYGFFDARDLALRVYDNVDSRLPSVSPVLGVSQNDAIRVQRSRISLQILFRRIPRFLAVFSGGLEE